MSWGHSVPIAPASVLFLFRLLLLGLESSLLGRSGGTCLASHLGSWLAPFHQGPQASQAGFTILELRTVDVRDDSKFIRRHDQHMTGLFPDSDEGIRVDASDRIKMNPNLTPRRGLVDVLSSRPAATGEMPLEIRPCRPCLAAQADGISGAVPLPGIRSWWGARRKGCRRI